jgi:hypothetical protein
MLRGSLRRPTAEYRKLLEYEEASNHRRKDDPEVAQTRLREHCLGHLAILGFPFTPDSSVAALVSVEKESLSPLIILHALLGDRQPQRWERSIEPRIREAQFAKPGILEAFDWNFNRKAPYFPYSPELEAAYRRQR